MRKVRTPRAIKTKPANKSKRPTAPMIYKIPKIKNKMINQEALKDKVGGSSLSNYVLDLMKLT